MKFVVRGTVAAWVVLWVKCCLVVGWPHLRDEGCGCAEDQTVPQMIGDTTFDGPQSSETPETCLACYQLPLVCFRGLV